MDYLEWGYSNQQIPEVGADFSLLDRIHTKTEWTTGLSKCSFYGIKEIHCYFKPLSLQNKSMNWFLCDMDLRHERVKAAFL